MKDFEPIQEMFIIHYNRSDDYIPYLLGVNQDTGSSSDNNLQKIFLKPGDNFNIKKIGSRKCIGHRSNLGKWELCTSGLDLPEKQVQCYRCGKDDFYQCRAYCAGIICRPSSPQAKELCTPPNTDVYLTVVAGKLKVGVSLNAFKRWLQQGSEIGVVIAKGPGLEARRYEQAIGQLDEIIMSVRSSRKLAYLRPRSFEKLKGQLIDGLELIQNVEIPDEMSSFEPTSSSEDIVDLSVYYGHMEDLESTPILLTVEDRQFGGKILGQKGRFLVIKDGNTPLAIDLNDLVGYTIQFLEEPPQRSGQTSLMDFF